DADHGLGQLRDHLLLLVVVEDALDQLHVHQWHGEPRFSVGCGLGERRAWSMWSRGSRLAPGSGRFPAVLQHFASDSGKFEVVTLTVGVRGPVPVQRSGTAVPLGGPKVRSLLAVLTAQRGRVLSTDRLCDALWGDQQPGSPVTTLQSHLSRLRRTI